jgi:hypothetical protein
VQGCYKATTVKIDNSPAITETVSLSKDLIPIFTKSCALSGCHAAGGQKPDLSSASAYNSLIKGNYVNIATPSGSIIYLWLTGKESVSMPIGAANNPSNVNALTLAWITQGAKNN